MNEAQRAAVLHGEGPLLLLAGPGSGKTFTITNRILYLIEQGAAPENILVITFMKEAALSMQDRFRKMSAGQFSSGGGILSGNAVTPCYPVNFGTFHSVFYHILKESHVLKSNDLLSNSEKKNLLLPILKDILKNRDASVSVSREELGEEALQILSAVSFYKNTMNLPAAAARAPSEWRQDFGFLCGAYERAVKQTGRLDFDDMLYDCKKLLESDSGLRSCWQNRFRHILIDEFQDINPVQYEAVKLLAARPYNLFAVGDDDQAIYGFRGSEPECLRRFVTEYHARQLLLDINYRSRPEIVQASLAVIGENKDRFVKELKAASGSEAQPGENCREKPWGKQEGFSEQVMLKTFETAGEQYDYMILRLGELCRGTESCAVLFRTNSYMQGFAARLKAADIPYEMKEKVTSIYDHFIVKDITAYLQTAQGQGTREQLLRIMNRPSRYISREALGAGEAGIPKMLRYYREAQLPRAQKEQVYRNLELFGRQLENLKNLSPLPGILYILKAVGYERYLKELAGGKTEKWQVWQELLEWLKEDMAKYKELKTWLCFQREYGETVKSGGKGKTEGKGGGTDCGKRPVQLLTVHGAKGLEYDHVWIPDCNEGVFPHGKMPDTKSVEEERRIFYVAMTRAKKSLMLLCLTGTKERPRLPSRFLNPLC